MADERDPIARIDARLERMEAKLDAALLLKAAVDYVIVAVTGAWIAIGGLFYSK